MNKKMTVLVVEDHELNRELLVEILKDQCIVLQATNGQEALDILNKREDIAAIVLDLFMPVLDGFKFMEAVSKIQSFKDIPIIVATEYGAEENEEKVLGLGAYDFISKPYKPSIVRLRVSNAIEHSRLATYEQLRYLEAYDRLTGLYNKDSFMKATRQVLNDAPADENYALLRFDITHFAMLNAYYGLEEGDNVLKYMADVLREEAGEHDLVSYGRMGDDDFCILLKYNSKEEMEPLIAHLREKITGYEISFNIVVIFGVYIIVDRNQTVETMIDNANFAAKQIKGNFVNTVAWYDEKLSSVRAREQEVVNEMKQALEEEQFLVYLQPKYDSEAGLPCGAEALVRWSHPTKGMISPGVFIPVFESNGFVEPIDHYMWEHVCILLRKWLDEGRNPLPISVNVSRVNLFNPRIVEEICELTDKYNVPKYLLQLEITESAYTDNGDQILDVINSFHDAGFTILMDDFGSGYSSLNVLKDMRVDVLKIDMKFFGKTENSSRAETIVASVVRMAKWLGIATVAEGVETREQMEFLKSIGCVTIQGYYYARPMPINEYEELVESGVKFISEDDIHGADSFEWANAPEINEIFNNVLEPIELSEVSGEEIDGIRVNRAFYDLFGYEDKIMFPKCPLDRALEEDKQRLKDSYIAVAATGGTDTIRYKRHMANGEVITIDATLKRLKAVEDRSLVLTTFDLVTDNKKIAENEEEQIKKIIKMCEEQADAHDSMIKPVISPSNHMSDMVDSVLRSKFNEKHALILVSVSRNDTEVVSAADERRRLIMTNTIEMLINQFFRTTRNMRTNDMISQISDNEYCIFMTSVPSEDMVSHKCHELSMRMKSFAMISKTDITVSIGIALSNKDDKNYENLYRMAREAVDLCHEQGGNRVYMLTSSNRQ